MNKAANIVVEDVLKEQVNDSATINEQRIKDTAEYICERLAEEGMLQKENQIKSNEILFAIKEERETELIQLCERYMYFLKERREDGSLIFEGRAGRKNATKKMSIGMILMRKKELLQILTKWVITEGGEEIDMMEDLRTHKRIPAI